MQFKVKDIGEQGLDVDLPVTPAWLAGECPDLDARPTASGLRFRGRLEPSSQDYLLRGQLQGELSVACSRCLEPAALELDVPVSVVYVEKGEREDDRRTTRSRPPTSSPSRTGWSTSGPRSATRSCWPSR